MLQTVTLTAGQTVEFKELANFFRVLAASAAVDVRFFKAGRVIADAIGVGAGYAERWRDEEFDAVTIYSASAQDVQFVIRRGNEVFFDAPPTGAVNVTSMVPPRSGPTQAAATVTNASASLVAAKANRSYLLIQNKDAAGNIWLNLAGAAATQANGVKIPPGGSLELNCNMLTAQIFAIGDIASNANIVVVEG